MRSEPGGLHGVQLESAGKPHHPPVPHALGKVAILGVGLIGGSLGQVLCAVHATDQVVGWDIDQQSLQLALQQNAIHSATDSPEQAILDAQLVVLAVPLEAVSPLLHRIAPALGPATVVTDTAALKQHIVTEGERAIGPRFIGGHPMAGSEYSGMGAASVDLFDAAAWALTPTERTDASAIAMVETMVQLAGAVPNRCNPADHDRIMAYISHLPHLLAYGLAESAFSVLGPACGELLAGSFRDGSRVAYSDPARWTEILIANRSTVSAALMRFMRWAMECDAALQSDDKAALGNLLAEGNNARTHLPR